MIFLNTEMDLFISKTDEEKFTSTNKKTLHLIFKKDWSLEIYLEFCFDTRFKDVAVATRFCEKEAI